MNLHVVVVHFPIALLTCYALLELLGLPNVFRAEFWTKVKALAVVAGTLFSMAAYWTGSEISHDFPGKLTQVHAFYANSTVWFFSFLSLAYLLRVGHLLKKLPAFLQKAGETVSSVMEGPYLMALIGVASLFLVTVTGALGGALAYGPDIDPMVTIVYHWLIQ